MTGEMLMQVLTARGIGALIGLEREFRTGNGPPTMTLMTRTALAREDGGIRYTWQATGRRSSHRAAVESPIQNDLVREFTVMQFDELS